MHNIHKLSTSTERACHLVWIIILHYFPPVWTLTESDAIYFLPCHIYKLIGSIDQFIPLSNNKISPEERIRVLNKRYGTLKYNLYIITKPGWFWIHLSLLYPWSQLSTSHLKSFRWLVSKYYISRSSTWHWCKNTIIYLTSIISPEENPKALNIIALLFQQLLLNHSDSLSLTVDGSK